MTPTTELFWLTATALMTASLWMPYVVNRMVERGVYGALDNPPRDAAAEAAWAHRLKAAHVNAVENLVVFAPLVLTAHVLEIHSSTTVGAATAFFVARLVHAVVYAAGVPVVRTLAFLVGFGAQVMFAVAILTSS